MSKASADVKEGEGEVEIFLKAKVPEKKFKEFQERFSGRATKKDLIEWAIEQIREELKNET